MTRLFASLVALVAASCASIQPAQVDRSRTVYAVLAEDDPAMASVRQDALADHLAFVEANFDRYAVAGPLLDQTGAMTRSLFLIYAEDEPDARAFMANDPYVASGLYADMTYRRFTPGARGWIGGMSWDPAAFAPSGSP